ncbi:MAG: hypothetical protein J7J65_05985 [Candidatus Korarchaeota archaeon]|nr:hypothetical protein [Candidatus Korarchaeota archaeon]
MNFLGYRHRRGWRGNKGRGIRRRLRGNGIAGFYRWSAIPRINPLAGNPVPYTQQAYPQEVRGDLVNEIYSLLPKIDCGACGFPTCRDCAEAIASGRASPDACRVVGSKVAPKIQRIIMSM